MLKKKNGFSPGWIKKIKVYKKNQDKNHTI